MELIKQNPKYSGTDCCDECNALKVDAVRLGEHPDYGSSTARVCRACLEKALNLLAPIEFHYKTRYSSRPPQTHPIVITNQDKEDA